MNKDHVPMGNLESPLGKIAGFDVRIVYTFFLRKTDRWQQAEYLIGVILIHSIKSNTLCLKPGKSNQRLKEASKLLR